MMEGCLEDSKSSYHVCEKSLQLCLTLCDSVDYSQASLSMGFSRQEY